MTVGRKELSLVGRDLEGRRPQRDYIVGVGHSDRLGDTDQKLQISREIVRLLMSKKKNYDFGHLFEFKVANQNHMVSQD